MKPSLPVFILVILTLSLAGCSSPRGPVYRHHPAWSSGYSPPYLFDDDPFDDDLSYWHRRRVNRAYRDCVNVYGRGDGYCYDRVQTRRDGWYR